MKSRYNCDFIELLEISILLCINLSSCGLVTSYTATRDLKSTFSSIV